MAGVLLALVGIGVAMGAMELLGGRLGDSRRQRTRERNLAEQEDWKASRAAAEKDAA